MQVHPNGVSLAIVSIFKRKIQVGTIQTYKYIYNWSRPQLIKLYSLKVWQLIFYILTYKFQSMAFVSSVTLPVVKAVTLDCAFYHLEGKIST